MICVSLIKEVELIIPLQKQNKTIKVKSLNGSDAIRENRPRQYIKLKKPCRTINKT